MQLTVQQKDFEYSESPDASSTGVAFEHAVCLLNSWVSINNVEIVTISLPSETVSPAIRLWYTEMVCPHASH